MPPGALVVREVPEPEVQVVAATTKEESREPCNHKPLRAMPVGHLLSNITVHTYGHGLYASSGLLSCVDVGVRQGRQVST
jgi:ribosomal protein L2